MTMKGKILAMAAFVSCAATLFGANDVPIVSNVEFVQPGGGRTVTVTYSLADAPAIVTMDVLTNGVSIGADKVTRLKGDVNKVVQPGANKKIEWIAKRDWPGHLIDENIVSVRLRAWALVEPPPYMVADLETPSNVTYYASVDALPDGGLSNRLYKTSRLVMRRIDAAGVRWNMGSHKTEKGVVYQNVEKIHSVQITNDYYIAVFPLTRGQFKKITGWAPSKTDAPSGADNEVYSVQWVPFVEMREVAPVNSTADTTTGNSDYYYPAAPASESFLGQLSTHTGVAFDLPGESEWEYACRAGNYCGYWGDGSLIVVGSSPYADANLDRLANYCHDGLGTGSCQPVGLYEPNAWGLYDMHGNLWEMCLDIYTENITDLDGAINTTIKSDSNNATFGLLHTDRGGARHKDARFCRAGYRDKDPGSRRLQYVGYRLVSRIAQ